ncbi:MAG: 30S ribosomal protein S9 [Bacilli bacterium]|nr:30S ribosomal protein S9 [Bacilli bacterium]
MKTFYATGRRKSSVAVVSLKTGKGKLTINKIGLDNPVNSYFKNNIAYLKEPLVILGSEKNYDINIKICGGGFSGQIDAARLALSKALVLAGSERSLLRKNGFLTTDSRCKERKKYGLKAARRASQFSKR